MKPIIIHSKTKSGKRFTAIAIIKNVPYKRISIGVALCSSKDCFNKSIGRKIAFGRALTGDHRNQQFLGEDRKVDYRLYLEQKLNGEITNVSDYIKLVRTALKNFINKN